MKKRVTFGFFGFLTIDYQAALAYLDAMAAQGWALAEVWLGVVARFRRTDRTDLYYYVDIAEPVPQDTPEYREHCRRAGWERLYTVRYMNIYRSLPGAETVPIQAPDEGTFRRYRADVARWCATCAVFLAVLVTLALTRYLLIGFPTVASLLRLSAASSTAAFLLFATPAALAGGAVYLAASVKRLFQWREAAKAGGWSDAPPLARARLRGTLTIFSYLGVAALAGCFALDLVSMPSAKPLIFLAAVIGVAVLMTYCSSGAHMRQPKRVRLWRCAALAGFVLALGLGRGLFSPAFSAMRAHVEAQLPALETPYDHMESYGSLFLSYARGTDELAVPAEIPMDRRLIVEQYDCYAPVMAERMARALWNYDMVPMEGRQDVWEGWKDGRYNLLSRRGSRVRLVSVPTASRDRTLTDRLLAWIVEE